MKTEFDLERYLQNSKAIDTSDINWDDVIKYPIDPGEIRCLKYMMDIESYTIMYLRDLLNTEASKDSDVASFLACWLYEETYHGLALEKFVRAAGVSVGTQRVQQLGEGRRLMESLETITTLAISKMTRHFVAAHMTWGAIQELTTLSGYSLLASKTKNPILATILKRVVLDESRHFSFYYVQAAKRLTNKSAQKLTSLLLRKFWSPVGAAVKPLDDVQFLMSYIFGGVEGERASKRVDRTISRLPGLGWFDLLESARAEYLGIQEHFNLFQPGPSLIAG